MVALALVTAAGLTLATIHNPAIGGYVLIAAVPIISGLKSGVPIPGFRPSEILIGGLAAVILVTAPRERRVGWKAFDWLALAYALTMALMGSYDLAASGAPFTNEVLGKLFGPFQFLLLYRAVTTSLQGDGRLRRAINLALFMSVPVSALAILQHFDQLGVRSILQNLTGTTPGDLSKDPGFVIGDRATGPFAAWHTLGGYLVVVVLLCVVLMLQGKASHLNLRAISLVLLPALAALLVTGSAAPVLGALAGSLLLGAWLGRLKPALVITAATVAAAVFFFSPLIEARCNQQFSGRAVIHGVTVPRR